MNSQLPMDIFVHIIKHNNESNGESSYSACLTIGCPDLGLDENSKEEFCCGTAGKSFFACIHALEERVLIWAETQGIGYISGLTDNKPCPMTLRTGFEEIEIVPITYNDWAAEPTHL